MHIGGTLSGAQATFVSDNGHSVPGYFGRGSNYAIRMDISSNVPKIIYKNVAVEVSTGLSAGGPYRISSGTTLGTNDMMTLTTDGDATFTGDVTPEGNLILPMGEFSYFDLTGTTVTIAAISDGSTNMVKAAPTSTLSSGAMSFDNGGANNGRLRYTGATTRMMHIACSVSFSGGNNDTIVIGIAKNGTVLSESKVLRMMNSNGDVGSTALHLYVTMNTNDYLEVFFGNTSAIANITCNSLNLFAMGM